jgi:phosphatidylserine synthase
MDGRWAGVIVLISVAAVFDALDGRTGAPVSNVKRLWCRA